MVAIPWLFLWKAIPGHPWFRSILIRNAKKPAQNSQPSTFRDALRVRFINNSPKKPLRYAAVATNGSVIQLD